MLVVGVAMMVVMGMAEGEEQGERLGGVHVARCVGGL